MTAAIPVAPRASESVFRPAALLMCGRMIAFAATFFIPVVLVRVLNPAQFGTYKQLFLIHSAVFFVAQLGMASSLYYFIPVAQGQAGQYVANSLVVLAGAGLAGFGLLVAAAPTIASWLNNAALSRYMFWIGLYLFLTMLSAALEMVLIARRKYLWASTSYALSDMARAAAFILPVLLFRQLDWLLKGAVLVASLRAVVSLLYFRMEFRSSLRPDKALLKTQLAYAWPFGLAVLVEILQGNLPAYVVSSLTNPATFAIFAVGCLQIPLVDFAASPTVDVMMVHMQQQLAQGRVQAVLNIWHDTTWKLALLFFPMVALVIVMAREIIVLLFTQKYIDSVPIFIAWTTLIVLTTFQVDGVLRVFAETRLILILNVVRLGIIAGLMKWSLLTLHLLGPACVIVLALVVFKAAALMRMKTLLGVTIGHLLPWRNLANLAAVAVGAAAVVLIVKSQLHISTIPLLCVTSVSYIVSYIMLVWNFKLLSVQERSSVTRVLGRFISTSDYWKG
jgi:O-antigen/teichoic acid export membrane protein